MLKIKITEGQPYPPGATWDGAGVNFSLYSQHAESVLLCLFESPNQKVESLCIPMLNRTHHVWHCYVSGIRPGQLYGYRIKGPYDPVNGHRFNPAKLLLDPYALAIGRDLTWHPSLFGYRYPYSFQEADLTDSAPYAPLGAVVDPTFCWGDDRPPAVPWRDTIIYEAHLSGYTRLNSLIPAELRGTYMGFASDPVVDYLRDLGVTAVEFMPISHPVSEYHLVKRGLENFWGYNPISYFAPNRRFAFGQHEGDSIDEFKSMVRILHQAGIEVILDVVYNHTAEGDHTGPTLSFRGIDNLSYYRHYPDRLDLYQDFTGCGNTLNLRNPRVLAMIMDSLRYWITEMHVDGFRFDLASALARELFEVDRLASFFDIIQQDPVISRVKLIAEPWDLGEGGYQVGNFPPGWSEWNGRYRDSVRRVINDQGGSISEYVTRVSGSSDLYRREDRRPQASINYITSHDGFTLRDLVSYDSKHNEGNGWNNLDGTPLNFSRNHGLEGNTDDPAILDLRLQKQKNFLMTLFFSQGVPMLLAGDEMNRTQGGNNNPYCQANELSFIRWEVDDTGRELMNFTRFLIHMRKRNEVLRRTDFFLGEKLAVMDMKDVYWVHPEGREMADDDWKSTGSVLGMLLPSEFGVRSDFYNTLEGNTLLVFFNHRDARTPFRIPENPAARWRVILRSDQRILTSEDLDRLNQGDSDSFFLESDIDAFINTVQNRMSEGRFYLQEETIDVPGNTIVVLKAEPGWKEAHVRRNIRDRSLRDLALSVGIQPAYTDFAGHERRLTQSELYRMLRSCGFPVRDPASLERAEQRREFEIWHTPVSPVAVATPGETGTIPGPELRLPEEVAERVHCVVVDEQKKEVLRFKLNRRDQALRLELIESRRIRHTSSLFGHELHNRYIRVLHLRYILPQLLPEGYYDLTFYCDDVEIGRSLLAVCPPQAFDFFELHGDVKYAAGIAVQLYALRSRQNMGIGDFADLEILGKRAASAGYRVIGLSPFHALFLNRPALRSPYFPSSRTGIHPIFVHLPLLPEWSLCDQAGRHFEELRGDIENERKRDLINYELVYRWKKDLFGLLFPVFNTHPSLADDRDAFAAWCDDAKHAFIHALYEVADDVFGSIEPPEDLFQPGSIWYDAFVQDHSEQIRFYMYMFWRARTQFEEVREHLREIGLSLYIDLAVGSSPDGAEAKANNLYRPGLISRSARAGAPPDPFSPVGQNWGLSVWVPEALKRYQYRPFIEMLRSNMLRNGILRIDHVMWLYRLFWIVEEVNGTSSTYIRYPSKDLFSILTLESRRNRTAIIGEDLGTVPHEVRLEMQRRNLYSWKVLYFEKEYGSGQFLLPDRYLPTSIATVNTHDLPTLAGFWSGRDIEERQRLKILTEQAAADAKKERQKDRSALLEALGRVDLKTDEMEEDMSMSPDLSAAIHRFLAASASKLFIVSLYDLTGEVDQPNLPGTVDEYPCWKLRNLVYLEDLGDNPYWNAINHAIRERLRGQVDVWRRPAGT